MKISEVLAMNLAHQSAKTHIATHREILGDGFLLNANPIYRRIKLSALKIGAIYTEAWPRYLLMPFHELKHIVETKTIPFIPSAKLLQEIEDRRPETFDLEDLNIPESYHLHEAAHVITEYAFEGVQFKKDEEKILKSILCESFANSCDAMACAFASTPNHQFFIQQNSYMHPQKKNMDAILRLIEGMGLKFAFQLVLFQYVQSNFLKEPLSTERIQSLAISAAPEARLTERNLKDCAAIGRMGEKLDPLFRMKTTEVFFKSEGFSGDVLETLNFSAMDVFLSRPEFKLAIDSMSDVIAGEVG